MRLLDDVERDGLRPHGFAVGSVETVQGPLRSVGGRGSDENSTIRDDRAFVAPNWQGDRPANVLFLGPFEGITAAFRDSVARGTSKRRPVGGTAGRGGDQAENGEQQTETPHAMETGSVILSAHNWGFPQVDIRCAGCNR